MLVLARGGDCATRRVTSHLNVAHHGLCCCFSCLHSYNFGLRGANAACQLSHSSSFFHHLRRRVSLSRCRTTCVYHQLSASNAHSRATIGVHRGLSQSFGLPSTIGPRLRHHVGSYITGLHRTVTAHGVMILRGCTSPRDGAIASHVIRPCRLVGSRHSIHYRRVHSRRGGAFQLSHVRSIRVVSIP